MRGRWSRSCGWTSRSLADGGGCRRGARAFWDLQAALSPDSKALWGRNAGIVVAWRLRDGATNWSPASEARRDLAVSLHGWAFEGRNGVWRTNGVTALPSLGEDLSPTGYKKTLLSPDGRYRLVRSGSSLGCIDTATRQRLLKVDIEPSWECGFDKRSRRVIIVIPRTDITETYELPEGHASSLSPWATDAASSGVPFSARAGDEAITLRDASTGRLLATFWLWPDGQWAVCAPDGRCNGDVARLEVVDGDRHLPVLSDGPLVDPDLFPRIR